jgi:hypothetical protein
MKWNYLLKSANVELGTKENLFVFFSGLSMTVTPAKVGEIWRSFLIKEMKGISLGRTVPVVIVDRLTDRLQLGLLFFSGHIFLQTRHLRTSLHANTSFGLYVCFETAKDLRIAE